MREVQKNLAGQGKSSFAKNAFTRCVHSETLIYLAKSTTFGGWCFARIQRKTLS
jgi:hypothetical protein